MKSDIEKQIARIDELLKTAPAYGIDMLNAQREVWVKRLEKFKDSPIEVESVISETEKHTRGRKTKELKK